MPNGWWEGLAQGLYIGAVGSLGVVRVDWWAVLCEPDLGQLSRLQHSIFPCPSCVTMALPYLLVLTSSFGYLCHHYLSLSNPYLPHNELFTLTLLLKVGLSGVPWSLRPAFDQLML